MRQYFLKRFFLLIPTLLGITLFCFVIMQMVPGGPVDQAIQKIKFGGETAVGGDVSTPTTSQNSGITDEDIRLLREHFGFDKPILVRYLLWLKNLALLDFGESYSYHKPVLSLIVSRLPVSLTFGIISFFLTYLICIPLGIAKAVWHHSIFDNISSVLIFIGYSIPGFVFGILLLVLFGGGSFFNWFPLGGVTSDYFEELSAWGKAMDFIYHMFLPIVCYVIGNFAFLTLLMKNSLISELNKDYLKATLSRGLSYKEAVLKHALRNALLPIATGIGSIILVLFAGSLLIETVFNINGIGRLSYEAIVNRDYPLVMGLVFIQSVLALLGRMLSDFCYVLIDPRIDF